MSVFTYNGPLSPNNPLFRNREYELNKIAQLCLGETEAYAMVCGGRQNGKTSLLLRLSTVLPKHIPICRIDFQAVSGATLSEVCNYISHRVLRSLSLSMNRSDIHNLPELTEFLVEILNIQEITRFVLMFEELAALTRPIQRDLANTIRAIFNQRFDFQYQSLSKLMIIIAGGVELFELAISDVSPLYNICEEIILPNLAESHAIELVTTGLQKLGLTDIRARSIAYQIYHQVEGHPYLTQRICGFIEHEIQKNQLIQEINMEFIEDHIILGDPLIRHILHTVKDRNLVPAVKAVMVSDVQFTRVDQEMVQLELIGITNEKDSLWKVRNQLLLKSLQNWLGQNTKLEDTTNNSVPLIQKGELSLPPFADIRAQCYLSIYCRHSLPVNIHASGSFIVNTATSTPLVLDTDLYIKYSDLAFQGDWKLITKDVGKRIYKQIFKDLPEILNNYQQSLGIAGDDDSLHFHFISSRDFLRVPLEFLHDGLYDSGDYFVLKHPVARGISGAAVRREPLSPEFLNTLWRDKQKLKVLLIGSNTNPSLPSVDVEIELLSKSIKNSFAEVGISTEIKALHTAEATYEKVQRELRRCPYHILHYAGHGIYDHQTPDNSYLSFWENINRTGIVKHMFVTELKRLLRQSQLRFAYLSCCYGTTTGEKTKLLDNDFLGIADGLTQAGIPSVLSYRWPVLDESAQKLAVSFYTSLAYHGWIDTALLDARCEIAGNDRNDLTWLSPLLIMQK